MINLESVIGYFDDLAQKDNLPYNAQRLHDVFCEHHKRYNKDCNVLRDKYIFDQMVSTYKAMRAFYRQK